MNRQPPLFDHERLEVYQKSLEFAGWIWELLPAIKGATSTKDQLERAADSIALNLAEGNGKFTERDRCKFFDISRGSALECAAALDLLRVKNRITPEQATTGKQFPFEIVKMLIGLIKANSSSRVAERISTDTTYDTKPQSPEQAPSPSTFS